MKYANKEFDKKIKEFGSSMTAVMLGLFGMTVHEYSVQVDNTQNLKDFHNQALLSDKWVAASDDQLYVGNSFATTLLPIAIHPNLDHCVTTA